VVGVLLARRAYTPTGRVRAGVGFCDGKNTPFQGLMADAAKAALWELLYAGFTVYAFIHDEVVVALDETKADEQALEVKRIVEAAAAAVMGHRVPAECEYVVAGHWKKPG
jgi:hypothetical protein